jgi:ring-1,2-phenylacetyl-CoA epoxidase subunit PaaE
VLLYGNKNTEEAIFYQELHDLRQKYLNRFFVYFVYSQAKETESIFGRIDKSAVNFVLNNKHKETSFDRYFICGPENMIDTVSGILKERNVTEEQILFEIFTPNNDSDIPIKAEGSAKVTVLVDDEETTFTMSKKEILLDAVLKEGVDAPYSCQGGICSSCMCRIVKGSAEMKRNSILTDDEIDDGLILSCQAIVTSDEIYIDYDDL